MANKTNVSDPSQAEKNVGEILSRTDQFIDKHLKQILIVAGAIVVIVIGIIVYHQYILKPKEDKARAELFPSQNYFANQQWALALNGDSIESIGFLDIIHEYGGTQSANLAKAYAGICQFQLGNYEEALKNLKSYSGKDQLFAAQITGAIGDCEVNLGKVKEGIASFNKAAAKADNSLLSPVYLNKAAIAYESLEDYKAALDIYQTIKTKYPESMEASTIDKNIERAKALMK
ncbi:MAG: tetratricopeptide repeat protein [Candidatus Symbiothrix sp.]|jgi:tetratricopeptide (TPR) repeat protein|nr:tetratricopeptide repeat protein [Candidatus Symbiothrix sp.]